MPGEESSNPCGAGAGAGETEAGAARRCERVGHRVTCSPRAGSEEERLCPSLSSSSGASKGPGLGYWVPGGPAEQRQERQECGSGPAGASAAGPEASPCSGQELPPVRQRQRRHPGGGKLRRFSVSVEQETPWHCSAEGVHLQLGRLAMHNLSSSGKHGAAELPRKKELLPGILASLLTLAMEMEDNDGLLSGLGLP